MILHLHCLDIVVYFLCSPYKFGLGECKSHLCTNPCTKWCCIGKDTTEGTNLKLANALSTKRHEVSKILHHRAPSLSNKWWSSFSGPTGKYTGLFHYQDLVHRSQEQTVMISLSPLRTIEWYHINKHAEHVTNISPSLKWKGLTIKSSRYTSNKVHVRLELWSRPQRNAYVPCGTIAMILKAVGRSID